MYMLDVIRKRAETSFGPFTSIDQLEAWKEHWFKTAEEIKEEMRKEGLFDTVAHIDELIALSRAALADDKYKKA